MRCGSTADLLFDHQFCELFRSVDRDITGLLRQQSSATPQQSNGEPAESVDLLQYKNFIREQDIKMQQWVEAYNVTSQELTLLRQQHEELTATVEILRDQNAVLAAQAVNHTLPGSAEEPLKLILNPQHAYCVTLRSPGTGRPHRPGRPHPGD